MKIENVSISKRGDKSSNALKVTRKQCSKILKLLFKDIFPVIYFEFYVLMVSFREQWNCRKIEIKIVEKLTSLLSLGYNCSSRNSFVALNVLKVFFKKYCNSWSKFLHREIMNCLQILPLV